MTYLTSRRIVLCHMSLGFEPPSLLLSYDAKCPLGFGPPSLLSQISFQELHMHPNTFKFLEDI